MLLYKPVVLSTNKSLLIFLFLKIRMSFLILAAGICSTWREKEKENNSHLFLLVKGESCRESREEE